MKLLRIFLSLLVLGTLLTSCGGDDCVQADWVGTYTGGAEVCNGVSDPVEITITASGDAAVIILITYSDGSGTVEFDPLTIDGCSITDSASEDGFTLDLDASLDDSTFTLNTEFTVDTETASCIYSGTRM